MRLLYVLRGLLMGLILAQPLAAQPALRFPNLQLDAGTGGYAPCEPSIAINIAHPDTIVAGAILDKVYYSHDGGRTWTKSRLESTYGVFGDPCLVSDYQGNVYYLHLADPSGLGWEGDRLLDRIVAQRSSDGGKTWTNGGYMGMHHPKDQDKEWMAADPRSNRLYTTWTQFDLYESREPGDRSNILFSMSKNGGKKWSKAVQINQFSGDCLDNDSTAEGAVPAVGPNGEVYVAWSLNGQIYFDRSLDGGKTWLDEDRTVSSQPGGWTFDIPGIFRCNGLPVTVCDLSTGPHRGTVYVHWADQRNGADDTDLWLSKSADGGMTWSAPLRINDDPPGKQQFLSWLTVDPATGYLYCVYYDRRAYDDEQTDVCLAWSADGGASFRNVRISDKPFKPDGAQFFGDYSNIAAYRGRIHPIWTRMDGGRTSIWTAVIRQADLDKLP
ncbi:MAG: sialidase family protein [Bacteroidia bacterium]|nr:sialidase family protein [Bacteroidia bacterium]